MFEKLKNINNEVIFENTTTFSQKEMNRFQDFHKRKAKWDVIGTILFIGCGFFTIFLVDILTKSFKNLLLIALVLVMWFLSFSMKEKKKIKDNKKKTNLTYKYVFYRFGVSSKDGTNYIPYFFLDKIYETPDNIYIYLNKSVAMILRKDGFTKGNYKDFLKFIRRRTLKIVHKRK